MAEIFANDISGLKVYGLQQVDYTIDGTKGFDYGTAIAVAALQKTDAVERSAEAFSAMVRLRIRKLDELGIALSILAEAIASLPVKGNGKDDLSHSDADLKKAEEIMQRYELTSLDLQIERNDNGSEISWKVTRESALMRKNELQYLMDTENNTLQQDMLAMQSLVSNRDNSFATASKLLSKVNNTSQSIIRNYGE